MKNKGISAPSRNRSSFWGVHRERQCPQHMHAPFPCAVRYWPRGGGERPQGLVAVAGIQGGRTGQRRGGVPSPASWTGGADHLPHRPLNRPLPGGRVTGSATHWTGSCPPCCPPWRRRRGQPACTPCPGLAGAILAGLAVSHRGGGVAPAHRPPRHAIGPPPQARPFAMP